MQADLFGAPAFIPPLAVRPAAPGLDLKAVFPLPAGDLFAWLDPSAPDYLAAVEARGWRLIHRFRQHVDCSLMRSDLWPSAEDYKRETGCSCDQCFWRRRVSADGTPDRRGEAARFLQHRIRRFKPWRAAPTIPPPPPGLGIMPSCGASAPRSIAISDASTKRHVDAENALAAR